MVINPQSQFRRQRSRDSLDRRGDNWIETGRQFVDGVSGNRPGKRKPGSRMDSVGRWVGDKLDWLLEEEDGWLEPWQTDIPMNSSGNKRPLDAISRRVSKNISSVPQKVEKNSPSGEWPEESSFRVNKWRRPLGDESKNFESFSSSSRTSSRSERNRPLPRSSRRRS